MAEKIKLKSHSDTRGILTVLDNEIKFKIKRVYFIYNVKKTRGGHRHKKNIQALIAIKGKCTVFVDNSKIKKNIAYLMIILKNSKRLKKFLEIHYL